MPEVQRTEQELRNAVRSLGSELYGAQRSLRETQVALSGLVKATGLYQKQVAEQLELYRGQRAWKLMLAVRAAYTRIVRQGWKGRFELLKELLLPGRRLNLAPEELIFPSLSDYIQPELDRYLGHGRLVTTHPSVANPSGKADVIVLAIVDFETRFQRPQQVAAEMARRGHRVFWVSPTRFLPAGSDAPYEILPIRQNLYELRLRGGFSDVYLGELLPARADCYLASLRQFYRDWAIADSLLMVQFPFWHRLAVAVRAEFLPVLIYDCMDDWETFENVGIFARQQEQSLASAADLVVVTAQRLVEKFQKRGVRPLLVRNGADLEFFRSSTVECPLEGVPKPVVGFFGAIADWADLELLERVAAARPQYSFVLVGQVFGRDTSKLEALGNVRLLGSQPYERIPGYLRQFDVSIIPFVLNQVTEATDPVKLYEYFSFGRPVVSTALAELEYCKDLVYIAKDATDFASKLDQALSESDETLPERRRLFAGENTWTHRVERIEEGVRDCSPRISILVVTFNSAGFIGPCLDSIARHTSYPNYEVVVVDNASTDETLAHVEERAGRDGRVRIHRSASNLGFAAANNLAAKMAGGEFLVFLNADTLVTPGWLFRLRWHLDQSPEVGLACAVTNFSGNETKVNVNYTDDAGMVEYALERASEHQHIALDIRMAPLFAVMVRRSLFEQLGGLDERYQVGMFEDDDFSLTVRQAGKSVIAAEDCFIHHFGQGSFARLSPAEYQAIFDRNLAAFEAKWGVRWTAHQTRPGVRPPLEEPRFQPAEFCRDATSPCPAR